MSDLEIATIRITCPCGCGTFGSCNRCNGSRVKARASRRERKMALVTSGTRHPMSGALSGVDVTLGDLLDVEETANVSLVRGLRRWWTSKAIQTKTARLMARTLRPRAFVASWDGKPRLVVMPWVDLVRLLGESAGTEDRQRKKWAAELERVVGEMRG